MNLHEPARSYTEERRLTPKQEQAAVSLASGCTIEVAARECGAAVRTVKLWLATVPAFKSRINQLRTEMTSQAVGRLIDSMTSAVETLSQLSRSAGSEMVKLLAATKVIEFAV